MLKRLIVTALVVGSILGVAAPVPAFWQSFSTAGLVNVAAPTVLSVSPNNGPTAGGTAIVISGVGYTGATAVAIGGVPAASFTVVNNGTINATTPTNVAGVANVAITTSSGTSVPNTLYTYTSATACGASQIASLPLGGFTPSTASNGDGGFAANADGSTGWTGNYFSVLQSSFTAPLNCFYTFTVNAYMTANPGVANQNSVQVYVDGIAIPAVGASLTNYFQQLVTNSSPSTGYNFSAPVLAGAHNVVVALMIGQNTTLTNNQGVHADRLIITETGTTMVAEPSGSRNPWNFPLSSWHYVNSAIGTNAIWSSGSTTADACLKAGGVAGPNSCPNAGSGGGANVNYGSDTAGFNQGQSTDPVGTFTLTNNTQPTFDYNGTNPHSLHITSNYVIAPGGDFQAVWGDASTTSTVANLRYLYPGEDSTNYSAGPPPAISVTGYGAVVDNYAQTQGYGPATQVFAGMIRQADIAAGVIAHTLIFGTQYSQMLAPATSINSLGWPVTLADYACAGANPSLCTGAMQWGVLVGIPASVNCSSLGLSSPYGVMLCVALQNYGAQQSINTGNANSPVNTIYGECVGTGTAVCGGNSTFQTAMGAIFTAWVSTAIQSNLRILTNNTPANFYNLDGVQTCQPTGCAKGGGGPLTAMLPGLVSGLPTINPTPAAPATQAPFKIAGMSYGNASGACLTTTVAAAAGSSVFFMGVQQNAFGGTFSGATDNGTGGSNGYSIAVQQTNAAVPTPVIMYSLNIAHALPVGSNICITGSFGGGTWAGDAWASTGVNGGLDQTAQQANASGHGFSFNSPTISQNNELLLFMFNGQTNLGTVTEGLSGVEMQDGTFSAGTYKVVTTGGVTTYSPNWSGNASATQAIMASFKIP